MITEVMAFLGYVFSFWMLWRIFDWLMRLWLPPKEKECASCAKLELLLKYAKADVQEVREREDQIRSQVASLENEVNFWKQFSPSLMDFINRATTENLMEVPNIGRAKAKKIIESRPYDNFNKMYHIGLSVQDVKSIQQYHENRFIFKDSKIQQLLNRARNGNL